MRRALCSLALAATCVTVNSRAHAAVLLVASEPSQINELKMAQVMADESWQWLSVRLGEHARLALITQGPEVTESLGSEAWLRALDFATRMRVAPPPDSASACGAASDSLADSGLPETAVILPREVATVSSELELRRSLEAAGLVVDLAELVQFTKDAPAPFRVAIYEAPDGGGATSALRIQAQGHALGVSGISAATRPSLPVTLIALANTGVVSANEPPADPGALAVAYLGGRSGTNYASARDQWLVANPTRWLSEASATPALFAWTVFPGSGQIAPVITRYFQAALGDGAAACQAAVESAHARASRELSDYRCPATDDLAQILSALDFGDVRLTRLFGALPVAGVALRVGDAAARNPRLVATDFDARDCQPTLSAAPSAGAPVAGGASVTPPVGDSTNGAANASSSSSSAAAASDRSSHASIAVGSSSDSCTGDSSSDDSGSSDSCSGDSSSGDSKASDSCSGNSSSTDSCSGDSSSDGKSDDSSGCGHSSYDGDTCSGDSAQGASDSPQKTSAALDLPRAARSPARPRRVHLSLLTLLAAALALPLRRGRSRGSLEA